MAQQENSLITEDEAALYDRQIRLWGLDAQKRLRQSEMLIVGMGGLGAEVCKNVVLAGVKSMVLLDHRNVTELDDCSQFLVSRDDVGKNRALSSVDKAQELNPNVKVSADTEDISTKPDDFFKQFDTVCLTCCTKETLLRVNQICHEHNIRFFAGDIFGYYGYMFADLNEHHYVEEKTKVIKSVPAPGEDTQPTKKQKTHLKETVYVQSTTTYCRLKEAFEKDWTVLSEKELKRSPSLYFILHILWKFQQAFGRNPQPSSLENDRTELVRIRDEVLDDFGVKLDVVGDDFACHCTAELSPVCAIIGGVLGQELIKAASGRDAPHNNFFFFDGVEGSGLVDCIKQ
ncbi:SUMO-activating enzyme subunit 1-like [Amphiura filiformis]|uniref:SUMO-activating enzyme subunit 1-like n=1 Tax=Amphiura filiformis TaxID=82378 RepID=UPI003B220092